MKKSQKLYAIISYNLWIGCTGSIEDVIDENPDATFIEINPEEWEEWENNTLHYDDIKDRPTYYAEIITKIKLIKL